MNGTVTARAVAWEFTKSKNKGTQGIEVSFQVEGQPRRLNWTGWFTDGTMTRTLESLEHCGWDGKSLKTLANSGTGSGMGTKAVELVVEEEEYDGKVRDRVQWVNALTFGAKLPDSDLDELEAKVFGRRPAPAKEEEFVDPFAE